MTRYNQRSVLVTGCATGIGRACVEHLAHQGYNVFAGVRCETDVHEIERAHRGAVIPLLLDVTEPASVAAARERLETSLSLQGLDALVNNAGIAVAGPLEYLAEKDLLRQFSVNVFGAMAMTRALLPLLRRARGRVVNVGSIAGRVTFPFLGPYSASKAALASLTATLRLELRSMGVQVCLVEPGSIATPIWDKSTRSALALLEGLPREAHKTYGAQMAATLSSSVLAASIGSTPAAVARAVAHALSSRRMKGRYTVGWDARLLILARRILPEHLWESLLLGLAYRGRRPGGVAETDGSVL